MKAGKVTVRFPREDEHSGRAPRIVVSAEGRLGDALAILPFALTLIGIGSLVIGLYQAAAPLWAYSLILPIIALGVAKTLEAR